MIPSARPDADDKTARLWQKFFLRQRARPVCIKKIQLLRCPRSAAFPDWNYFLRRAGQKP